MKRYEQSIRVITAFFAVLLGFGLKKLLDAEAFNPPNARWPCFLMSVFLFLRFLLGSNNHMWVEFVRPDRQEGPDADENISHISHIQIFFDFFFLVVFGLIGVSICYSTNVDQFLNGNLLLTGIALGWASVYKVIGCARRLPPGKWAYWFWVNLVQFFSIFMIYYLVIPMNWGTIPGCLSIFLPGPAWDWSLFVLALVYLAIFSWDFLTQLAILKEGSLIKVAPAAGNSR
jgi:hypothetical protein